MIFQAEKTFRTAYAYEMLGASLSGRDSRPSSLETLSSGRGGNVTKAVLKILDTPPRTTPPPIPSSPLFLATAAAWNRWSIRSYQ